MLRLVPDPPKEEEEKESDFFKSPEYQKFIKELKAEFDELDKIHEEMKAQGLWTDERETVECPYCKLFEDITFEGRLVVCRREDPDKDTGLSFEINESNGKTKCPQCLKSFIANLHPEIEFNEEDG